MTEGWAIAILYAGSMALTGFLVIGLRLLGAPFEIIGLGSTLGVVTVGVGAGLVTAHYGPSRRARHDDD